MEMTIKEAIKAVKKGKKVYGYVSITSEDGTYILLVKKDVLTWLNDCLEKECDFMVNCKIDNSCVYFN